MTNEEAIKILQDGFHFRSAFGIIDGSNALFIAINSLKENTKLKAEIEQLKEELEICKNRQALSEKEKMIQGLNDFCDKFEMCNQCIFYGRCADFDELSFEEIKSQLEEAEKSLKGIL